MTRILALETSTAACSVAIFTGERVLQDHRIVPRQHNRLILSMVDDLLIRAQLQVNNLDAIAFSRGPGSFTGLRIGAAVAQGLCMPFDTPLMGISTLEILALTGLRKALETNTKRYPGALTLLQSKPGEVYLGAYEFDFRTDRLCPIGDDGVCSSDEIEIPQRCRDWLIVGQALAGSEQDTLEDVLPEAAALVELVRQRLSDGVIGSTQDLELVYPRGSSPWKKQETAS